MIYNLKLWLCLIAIFLYLTSCDPGPSNGPTIDLTGYQTESIGGGAKAVSFINENQQPLAEGHVINNIRNGTWSTFHPGTKKLNTITNYVNGLRNGT